MNTGLPEYAEAELRIIRITKSIKKILLKLKKRIIEPNSIYKKFQEFSEKSVRHPLLFCLREPTYQPRRFPV